MIEITRIKTGTKITVQLPIKIDQYSYLQPYVSMYLNNWVEYHFPGFVISGFIT